MACHRCGAEAVGRCYHCGALYCSAHGDGICELCDGAFAAGDPPADRVTTARRPTVRAFGWWRPRPAEGYTPPACYCCQAIARSVCLHCERRYCPEHTGRNGLCMECSRSSVFGLVVMGIVAVLFVLIMLVGWFQRRG
ncbi:MAG: hypothetical protein NZO58_05680 [Gemmataceae bacterium]|nr:hypothetical protein [Gemmataceae bacterium]